MTSQLRQRETNNGKAQALGDAAVLLHDPNRVNTDIERLQRVTAADVGRVMRKYVSDTNRVVIYYLPQAMKPATSANSTNEKKQSIGLCLVPPGNNVKHSSGSSEQVCHLAFESDTRAS